jgi:chloramphenicol O-acetyltransferase
VAILETNSNLFVGTLVTWAKTKTISTCFEIQRSDLISSKSSTCIYASCTLQYMLLKRNSGHFFFFFFFLHTINKTISSIENLSIRVLFGKMLKYALLFLYVNQPSFYIEKEKSIKYRCIL